MPLVIVRTAPLHQQLQNGAEGYVNEESEDEIRQDVAPGARLGLPEKEPSDEHQPHQAVHEVLGNDGEDPQ